MTIQEGAGPGPKPAASPPKRVQVEMLRTSRESSDSDEEPEHELAYLVRARMERPIVDVKVDISLADVKSELGAEFISRTSPLIAF